jgi:hypothetical protein
MTKPTKYVTANCACGASFQREVKRGRPQVWCPKCQAVPFYERVQGQAAAPVAQAGEAEVPAAPKPKRPFDSYGAVRDEIEAQVATLYGEYHEWVAEVTAAAAAKGRSKFTIDFDAYELGDKLKAIYAQYKPVKADGFQDEQEAA